MITRIAHDNALWRDDTAFVRSLLPGANGVFEYAGEKWELRNCIKS